MYIIRHGEKTFHAGCLDIQGQERANNLQNVFSGTRNFSRPTAIFANKYNYQPECERCWLTVQAIAQNLSLTRLPVRLNGRRIVPLRPSPQRLRVTTKLILT